MIPDEKSHGLGIERQSRKTNGLLCSDDIGLRSPVIQKALLPKKGIPYATIEVHSLFF